jgi:hypothetical protein
MFDFLQKEKLEFGDILTMVDLVRRVKTTLEMGGEDDKIHSERAKKITLERVNSHTFCAKNI